MIHWECRQCGEGIEVPESLASDAIECPQCGVFSRPPEELIPKVITAPESAPKPKLPPPDNAAFSPVAPLDAAPPLPPLVRSMRDARSITISGRVFTLIGVALCLIAFVIPTARNGTHNIGLINNRTVFAVIASGILVSGALVYGIGLGTMAIVRAMQDKEGE
ncbi:MAG: hypothetical protein KDA29_12590 [Phycisphaerales bacterium]|nr:hypothetical protein [Phycisphaerales bacterium]